ncbi:hypothetical protein MKW94_017030 [Papaver nudicaule]|uniref:Uncharacterized protein n=1 Tax=Papaver nudicaule TaxID=74823 RepID=A0AA41S1Z0_PAPNU|nr:hypothetical protein [Papaver nudicaule]
MFYGAVVWDPWLIVSQIICLQCLYYLTLGILMSILVRTRASRMSLVYFFDYSTLTTSTVTGWCVIVVFLLTSLAGSRHPTHFSLSSLVLGNCLSLCAVSQHLHSKTLSSLINGFICFRPPDFRKLYSKKYFAGCYCRFY